MRRAHRPGMAPPVPQLLRLGAGLDPAGTPGAGHAASVVRRSARPGPRGRTRTRGPRRAAHPPARPARAAEGGMIGPDPLDTVWAALDAAGYDPHGQEHDFRARCPGHDGENRDALHVSEG